MADAQNPWVSRPRQEPSAAVVPAATITEPTGPTAPQAGVPAPDRVDRLPVSTHHSTAPLWWVGAHGGAGESSLAGIVPDWRAAEHGWPLVPGQVGPSRVVVTARSNVRGLRAAQTAAQQWASGLVPHVDVVGLVIVADAPGRLPKPLRDLAQVIAGGFPRTWMVPWIESWRLGEPSALTDAPREVRRLVDELSEILRPGAAGTTH